MTCAKDTPGIETESQPGDVPTSELGWLKRLGPKAYSVLRQGGTEHPFTGTYVSPRAAGTYACKACGQVLFTAHEQFQAHCGWPAFWAPAGDDAVVLREDNSHGMRRTEVRCARCDSHLGHVFTGEGYQTPTDERFCINSICLVHSDDSLNPGSPGPT
ncbi:peptide-methionine (R)-S-oxide reductase MsrB [Devriesea agamarum]|uniref:peptide-methionine (R)-S-oxide reductase MsrB n=1 Tax=Devriesea agamarum TaxID=472569 RepID=UPI00071DA1EF|nr:peptide-methionine (R)-S-oxide reductase MsrB [Devriesea agamarum]